MYSYVKIFQYYFLAEVEASFIQSKRSEQRYSITLQFFRLFQTFELFLRTV